MNDLIQAAKIVEELDKWLSSEMGLNTYPVPSLIWSPATLAILIGEDCVWEDQDPEGEMEFESIRNNYKEHIKTLSKLIEYDDLPYESGGIR